ncbi:TraB/GumN family protein [Cognatilysobacter lacus]|uniref:TraB/GumN family protein n=1 Tax=Cognatilysobacter lacus TaxID=1643323 RepID=A0A5D8Z640_9GAMM|nr:TraB/GumN family protein [Lysobacter lacus]TZF90167.1 TraB/GumN family protein [Lysobacter lacus]
MPARMHRIILILAGALLALPVVGSTPRAPQQAPPVPLLWKVSDADSHIYLLGSFHLLAKSDYPLSPDIDRAFDDAEALVFEVAPEDLNDPGVTPRMLALAASDPASSIARVMPANLKPALDRRLASLGLPSDRMASFEPWFVDTMLVTMLGQRSGYAPDDGLDRVLMARAQQAGKPASGLETVDQQLATLDGTPIAEQVASLREFVEEGDQAPAKLDELHAAWRNADVPALERLTREEMRDLTPVTYQRMVAERNRAWVPQLERLLAQGRGHDVLVVVGALHLLGEDGVVDQLRARGYRVERICTVCRPKATR